MNCLIDIIYVKKGTENHVAKIWRTKIYIFFYIKIFTSANGGPRSRVRTLDPQLSPPSRLVEIFQRMCLGGGVPRIFFHPKSYFFCELKPHAKFRNPTLTPSGRKVTRAEREKRKNAVNSGHLVP